MQCAATKQKCAVTKEGSKKSRRVYTRNMEGTGVEKKTEEGEGKERKRKETRRGRQRDGVGG